MRAFIIWELLVILMTLTVAGMVQASDALWRWETARWANQQRMLQRLSMRLSPQELRLLPLLARKDLKYEQIAAILCISPETVKTHVRRLGSKLGVRGRWEVVAATRTYGLMPGDE